MHGGVWEADLVSVQSQRDSDDFNTDLNRSKRVHLSCTLSLSLSPSLCHNTHSYTFITLSLISLSYVLLLLDTLWQRIWSNSGSWILSWMSGCLSRLTQTQKYVCVISCTQWFHATGQWLNWGDWGTWWPVWHKPTITVTFVSSKGEHARH